jgi:hypothetical protein
VCSFVIEALPAMASRRCSSPARGSAGRRRRAADQLDTLLLDPLRCWCRLELLPDAGASTVGLTIAALPDEQLPDIDDVRDLWSPRSAASVAERCELRRQPGPAAHRERRVRTWSRGPSAARGDGEIDNE